MLSESVKSILLDRKSCFTNQTSCSPGCQETNLVFHETFGEIKKTSLVID